MTVQGNRGVALVVRAALRLGSGGMGRIGNQQSGIAIGSILFVVAILAVLATAIAAGSGAFNGDTSAVRNKAIAVALLEYADSVKVAVDRLLAKGCTDTQISFENPFVSGYTNPNAPSDKSCHVFDVNGGGIVWKNAPQEVYFDGQYGQWRFLTGAGRSLSGLGTSEHDLFMVIGGTVSHVHPGVVAKGEVLLPVCKEINRMLGIGSGSGIAGFPKYVSNSPFTERFQGIFSPDSGAWSPEAAMIGQTTLCAGQPTPGYMIFIKVLIVR